MSSDKDNFIPSSEGGAADWANRVKHRTLRRSNARLVRKDLGLLRRITLKRETIE